MNTLNHMTDDQIRELIDSGFRSEHKTLEEYINESGGELTVSDETANRINAGIDILLIQEYFKNRDFNFPLRNYYKIFNSEGVRIKASESNLLLNSPNSLKSFHLIFNEYIITELQNCLNCY